MQTTINHDNELPTPAAKQQERCKIESMVDQFLRQGGTIQTLEMGLRTTDQAFADPKSKISDKNRESAQSHKQRYQFSKETAIENGHKTFFGLRCVKCESYERWTASGGCINCKPEPVVGTKRLAEHARKAASIARAPTYEGSPCLTCSGTTRDTMTGNCVNDNAHRKSRKALCKQIRQNDSASGAAASMR